MTPPSTTPINGGNSLAVQYNESILPYLVECSTSLFKALGLTTFGYKRVFEDGRYLFLSTNHDWCTHHYYHVHDHGSFFQNAMDQSALATTRFHRVLWPSTSSDHFLESLNHFGMWNGLNFYRKRGDSLELWTFSTDPDTYQDPNHYLSIIDHLEQFIAFFNVTANELINLSDPKKLGKLRIPYTPILSSTPLSIKTHSPNFSPPLSLDDFLNTIKIDRLPLKTAGGLVYLSKKETECVALLSHGKSAKEIGADLCMSPRTAESHLKNIKEKTGCLYASDIISAFHQSCLSMGLNPGKFLSIKEC